MIFPSAMGVLVERGSLLSHAAIVARELGIPAIVSIPGVTRWLKDGDWVRVRWQHRSRAANQRASERRGLQVRSEAAARADFSEIRYAQVWEDADVLLEGLDVQPGHVCVSIASAGDNALALLTRDPARVVALDLSPAQLACLELRVAAYRALDTRSSSSSSARAHRLGARRSTLGVAPASLMTAGGSGTRGTTRSRGRHRQRREIRALLRLFRNRRVLPLVHPAPRVLDLLTPRDRQARERFYEQEWNTWRWRVLFRVFFSRTAMGRLGRDPEFFRYVSGDVASRILERTRHALTALDPAANPYLHWILTGTHGAALPVGPSRRALRTHPPAISIGSNGDASRSRHLSPEPTALQHRSLQSQRPVRVCVGWTITIGLLETSWSRLAARTRALAYWNMLAPRRRACRNGSIACDPSTSSPRACIRPIRPSSTAPSLSRRSSERRPRVARSSLGWQSQRSWLAFVAVARGRFKLFQRRFAPHPELPQENCCTQVPGLLTLSFPFLFDRTCGRSCSSPAAAHSS